MMMQRLKALYSSIYRNGIWDKKMWCCGAEVGMIKEIDDAGYQYLSILELDKLKETEMKDKFQTEYLRQFKLHEISAQW